MKRAESDSDNDSKLPPVDERKPAAVDFSASNREESDKDEEMETIPEMGAGSTKKPPPWASLPQAESNTDNTDSSPPVARKKKGRQKNPETSSTKGKPPLAKLIGNKKRPIGQVLEEEAPDNETPEERRLRRNRINDRRKRARRAMKVEFLNEQFDALTTQNEGLRDENKVLREKIAALRRMKGLEDAKFDPSSSEESETNHQSDLLANRPHRSRLDGTIMAAMNLTAAQAAALAAARAQSHAAEQIQEQAPDQGNEEAKVDVNIPEVPQEPARPIEANQHQPAHADQQPLVINLPREANPQQLHVGENSASSATLGQGAALSMDQLRVALGQLNSSGDRSQPHQVPISLLLSLLQGQPEQQHPQPQPQPQPQQQQSQHISLQQIASLLQAKSSIAVNASHVQQGNQNVTPGLGHQRRSQGLPGQADQLAALILHQQRDNPALLASLFQHNQGTASTGQSLLIPLLQQQPQNRGEDISPQVMQLLRQHQNADQGAAQRASPFQQQQRHPPQNPSVGQLTVLHQQQQQQQNDNNRLAAHFTSLQGQRQADDTARRQLLLALLQPQQQSTTARPQASLTELLHLHQGPSRGDGLAQLLTSLQQAAGDRDRTGRTQGNASSTRGGQAVDPLEAATRLAQQGGVEGLSSQELLALLQLQFDGEQGVTAPPPAPP